jgi:MCP family monocarboxylic acid transporter-like MFS transporter 10
MRILSVALLVVLLPGLPFIRSRLPEVRNCGPVVRRQHHDRSYLKNYLFWVLMAMNITQGFAYYIPAMWLPSKSDPLYSHCQRLAYAHLLAFASSVDLTVSQSALTVALLNGKLLLVHAVHCNSSLDPGASAIGRLMIGSAADVIDPWLIAFVTLITTTGAVFILWGVLAHTLSGLLAFGFVYGIIAGSFCSLWACLVR